MKTNKKILFIPIIGLIYNIILIYLDDEIEKDIVKTLAMLYHVVIIIGLINILK